MVPFADSCLVKQCIEKSVEGAELIPFLPEIKNTPLKNRAGYI